MPTLIPIGDYGEHLLKQPFYRKVLKYTFLGIEERDGFFTSECKMQACKEEIELSCGHKQFYYHTGIHFDVVECETCKKEGKEFI